MRLHNMKFYLQKIVTKTDPVKKNSTAYYASKTELKIPSFSSFWRYIDVDYLQECLNAPVKVMFLFYEFDN